MIIKQDIQVLTDKYNALPIYTAKECLEYWTEIAKLDRQYVVEHIGHNFNFAMRVANELKQISIEMALDFAKFVILTTGNVR